MEPLENCLLSLKVGDTVFVEASGYGCFYREALPATVITVAEGFIYTRNWKETCKFSLETGISTGSIRSHKLWATKEAFEESLRKEEIIGIQGGGIKD